MIDIVVLNYNDWEKTIEFVEQFSNYSNVDHILVVDNASTDNSLIELNHILSEKILLLKNEINGGYGYGNNKGVNYLFEHYRSKHILIANPDTKISEKVISQLLLFFDNNPDYAIVAPTMKDINDNICLNTTWRRPSKFEYILSFGGLLSKFCHFYEKGKIKNNFGVIDTFAVSGSLFLIDVEKFLRINGFDENLFLYCEETTLGFRVKNGGFKTACLSNVFFRHEHSASISKKYKKEIERYKLLSNSKKYVLKKYYNANIIDSLLANFIYHFTIFELKIKSIFKG